jgi:hypothetical protein
VSREEKEVAFPPYGHYLPDDIGHGTSQFYDIGLLRRGIVMISTGL